MVGRSRSLLVPHDLEIHEVPQKFGPKKTLILSVVVVAWWLALVKREMGNILGTRPILDGYTPPCHGLSSMRVRKKKSPFPAKREPPFRFRSRAHQRCFDFRTNLNKYLTHGNLFY